jgi:hypothetical protein
MVWKGLLQAALLNDALLPEGSSGAVFCLMIGTSVSIMGIIEE